MSRALRRALPYVAIARPDHWFKNVFALPGLVVALTTMPQIDPSATAASFTLALVGLCLVASSNYTLNELLDASRDAHHPTKKLRPVALGLVETPLAVAQWLALGGIGLSIGWSVNQGVLAALALLWVMGIVYNVPPLRTKDHPYFDVLSESVNNPIRLWAGWAAAGSALVPPLSLLTSYWMLGAFFMAVKRLAEYRAIGDPVVAARYRRSFAHYDEPRLLISIVAYVAASAMLGGIFITRYALELVLAVPALAIFFAYYLAIGLRPGSAAAHPERLVKDARFFTLALLTFALCVLLVTIDLPWLKAFFDPSIPLQGP